MEKVNVFESRIEINIKKIRKSEFEDILNDVEGFVSKEIDDTFSLYGTYEKGKIKSGKVLMQDTNYNFLKVLKVYISQDEKVSKDGFDCCKEYEVLEKEEIEEVFKKQFSFYLDDEE